MHYVYILYSVAKNKFYIGETQNLEQRLAQHNRGMNPSTAPHVPWSLAFSAEKPDREAALRLEKKLKNLHSPERILAFIKKYGSWNFPEY